MRSATFAFVGLLLVYGLIAALFATRIPAWQVPDEPAHYNYTRQVAQTGQLPVLEPSDWTANFSPPGPDKRDIAYENLTYEDHQPPLFYLSAVPVFQLTGGSLTALRLWSVFISLFSLIFAYLTLRAIFPAQAWVALAATAFMAFLPQRVHMMAGFNNDSLSEAMIALVVFLCVRMLLRRGALKSGERDRVSVGALLGIGIATGVALWVKAQTYLLLPLIGIALLMALARGKIGVRALVGVPVLALLIAAPWWLRNINLYGGTDFLGLQRHDAVVAGQLTSAQHLAEVGTGGFVRELLQTTFQSFWGQFGWMSIPIDRRLYIALLGFTVVSALLFVGWWLRDGGRKTEDGERTASADNASVLGLPSSVASSALTLLACLALGAVLAFVWYNTKFVQFQGRYLYPGMIPIALMFTFGWQWVLRRWPVLQRNVWLAFALGFAAFDVYLLQRVVLRAMGGG